MLEAEDTRTTEDLYYDWSGSYCQCTGTTVKGEPCGATCKHKLDFDEFWPGVTDRCVHHVDELDRRSRDIAWVAQKTGADPVESLRPIERAKRLEQIRRARLRERPPARRTGRAFQATFGFARPLWRRLEEPPRLEPGVRATKSNAVDPPAVKTAGRAAPWPA
jgi:hypothetical protein